MNIPIPSTFAEWTGLISAIGVTIGVFRWLQTPFQKVNSYEHRLNGIDEEIRSIHATINTLIGKG